MRTGWDEAFNDRVLTAKRCVGPWKEHVDGKLVDRDGEHWTVIDRDTGELIGAFGLKVEMPTCDAALAEAERFGSKWDWPTDRVAVVDDEERRSQMGETP